ncbi:MAG: hypothetical protein WA902_02910 [Thermosynechococcaceae cyanobacterium]
MRVAVLGANGSTGSEIVRLAEANSSHEVVVMSICHGGALSAAKATTLYSDGIRAVRSAIRHWLSEVIGSTGSCHPG